MPDKRFRVQKLPILQLNSQHEQILPATPNTPKGTRRLISALLGSALAVGDDVRAVKE
jgi:hypothetical protein